MKTIFTILLLQTAFSLFAKSFAAESIALGDWKINEAMEYAYTEASDGSVFGMFCYSSVQAECSYGVQLDSNCEVESRRYLLLTEKGREFSGVSVRTNIRELKIEARPLVLDCLATDVYYPYRPKSFGLWIFAKSYFNQGQILSELDTMIREDNIIELSIPPRTHSESHRVLQFSLEGSAQAIRRVHDKRRALVPILSESLNALSASMTADVLDGLDNKDVGMFLKRRRLSRKPKVFMGYACRKDCSGHKAGFEWARKNKIDDVSVCASAGNNNDSQSFDEGCEAYVFSNE